MLRAALRRLRRAPADPALLPEIMGYEHDQLTAVTFAKTLAFRATVNDRPVESPALLLALADLPSAAIPCVIDVGGACGAHYWQARAVTQRDYHWWVVETAGMVARAKALEDGFVRFVSDLSEVTDRPHVIFASGSLQYTPEPIPLLRRLLKLGAPRVVVCRLPLSEGGAPVRHRQRSLLSNNGYGPLPVGVKDAYCLYDEWILPRSVLEAAILAEGYQIAARWPDPSGDMPPYKGAAYLLKRTDAK